MGDAWAFVNTDLGRDLQSSSGNPARFFESGSLKEKPGPLPSASCLSRGCLLLACALRTPFIIRVLADAEPRGHLILDFSALKIVNKVSGVRCFVIAMEK